MPLGAAITLTVMLVLGVTVLVYAGARFVLAWKRGELRMTAFNTLTGRWSDDAERADRDRKPEA